jgi:lipoprotein NlpD
VGPARAAARLAVLAALLSACAHRPVAKAGPVAQRFDELHLSGTQQPGVVHHVRAGETLWRISQTYGVPVEVLQRENVLAGLDLVEGQALFIPGAVEELEVPSPGIIQARHAARSPHRASPTQIPRAGGAHALDPAAHGEPLGWPAPGVLISGFGTRERDAHEGIDLAAPEGTPVFAAEDGTVLFAGQQRGYGNLVLLAHKNDLVTVYAHNEENLVRKGQNVARGETIARIGHTGNATGPHLHFEVRVAARPRDPLGFLR